MAAILQLFSAQMLLQLPTSMQQRTGDMISIQLTPMVIISTGLKMAKQRICYRTVSTLEKIVIRIARKLVVD